TAVRRQKLLLQATDRQHTTPERDLARHGEVAPHRNFHEGAHERGHHGHTRARPVLANEIREVNVDIHLLVDVFLKPEPVEPRPDVAHRRLRALLHPLFEEPGDHELSLAWHYGRFGREQVSTVLGHGEPVDEANLVSLLLLAQSKL